MCGPEGAAAGGRGAALSRRALLAGTAAVAGSMLLGRRVPAAAASAGTVDLDGVDVLPRAAWAGDLAPTGPIAAEPDVRYLLVHHSVDPGNGYAEADVAAVLRSFYRFHTSPAKGWPDLAYNFLVDRFGRVWEGRAGSLAGPVAGDATGGNQGFDQLCCFIGNHQAGDPSPEAVAAMARLLGALARRHGIAVGGDATATFTSRGSNRHPAGAVVTTATVAGHRDMSRTQCPGDRVVARLPDLRLLAAGGTTPAPTPPPATTLPPATTPPPAPAFSGPKTPYIDAARPENAGRGGGGGGIAGPAAVAAAAAAAAAAATGAIAVGRRRPEPPPPPPPRP